jgi:LemA protein
MNKILLVVAGVVVLVVLVLAFLSIGSYNSLVAQQEEVNAKWSEVENQLQRRSDLIGNLVGAVQGILTQEQVVFADIANARAGLTSALGRNDKNAAIAADNQLSAAIRSLNFLNITENYPQLRSNENVLRLQDELAGTENRLATSRGDYNKTVRDYNVARRTFPKSIVASLFGFSEETAYFEAAADAKQAPKVQFNDPRNTNK